MVTVFFSYSHKDEDLRDRLETHLTMLKRQGFVEIWHDRRLKAGDDFADEISDELENAHVILLLVSPDFLASKYCYDIEMRRALERHKLGEARVIPIILRHCDWHSAPFGGLLAAPKDGRPVVSWPDLDEAFLDITNAIRAALQPDSDSNEEISWVQSPEIVAPAVSTQRSSNLRLRKTFSDADRDQFLESAFEYMVKFFENSLIELAARSQKIERYLKCVDTNRFIARIYEDGQRISSCTISLGGPLGDGIFFLEGEERADSSFNEQLSVDSDDQGLCLRPLGMGAFGNVTDHLSFEGAAELYWGKFIARIQ